MNPSTRCRLDLLPCGGHPPTCRTVGFGAESTVLGHNTTALMTVRYGNDDAAAATAFFSLAPLV